MKGKNPSGSPSCFFWTRFSSLKGCSLWETVPIVYFLAWELSLSFGWDYQQIWSHRSLSPPFLRSSTVNKASPQQSLSTESFGRTWSVKVNITQIRAWLGLPKEINQSRFCWHHLSCGDMCVKTHQTLWLTSTLVPIKWPNLVSALALFSWQKYGVEVNL